jgi:hypothetical protein
MTTALSNPGITDCEPRQRVYNGQVLVHSASRASLALVGHARRKLLNPDRVRDADPGKWCLFMGLGVLLGWGELISWRASRQHLPEAASPSDIGPRTIVVLGYPSAKDGSTSWLQRYRVRIALRSYRPGDVVVFCGGVTRGATRSEAAVMADHAERCGLPVEAIVLEDRSRSTWENIENSRPLLGGGPVVIASNTLHARRARAYLWRQEQPAALRLRRGNDYRMGELLLLKPFLVLHAK